MNNFLNKVDCDNFISNSSIEINWHHFKNLLTTATEQFVPTASMKSQKLNPPWWNKSLASAVAMKCKLYLKYMQTSSHIDYCNYVTQRSLVKVESEVLRLVM